VTVEAGASVWFNAVLRADFGAIIVREGANVQDGSVLHAGPDGPVEVGPGATIGHACVVHACTIGAQALIANHATVLDHAVVGARSLVAAGALVTGGTVIPDGVLAIGAPARVMGPIEGTNAEAWVEGNPAAYQELAQRYLAGFGTAGSGGV
jgi:carbonic anhydrase/acetyltransferase-like protein (isoleucine patch superfamily)